MVDQILKGIETGENATEQLFFYDYIISLCIDCRTCKNGNYLCCKNDEMQEIYPRMEKVGLIIFGTPL